MFQSYKYRIWIGVLFTAMFALGACTGEIPPELLEAVDAVESGGIEALEIDFSDLAEELEFIGEVQAIATTEWTVAGLDFLVEGTTEIKGNPQVGDEVKVHATLTTTGALLAREIETTTGDNGFTEDDDEAFPFDLQDEFEFVGLVDAIGSEAWTISGRTLVILPITEIKGVFNPGDLVKVHAFLNQAGELAAREIEPALAGDEGDQFAFDLEHEIEFIALVEAMGGDVWTVGGRTIIVLPETEIKGEIAVGDLVKVHAFLNSAGELAAREIEPALPTQMDEDDLDEDNDLKLIGTLEQIGDGIWVVAGVEFQVTPDTEIEDGLSVGDWVEIYFFTSSDGLPLAREIEAEDASDDDIDDFDDDELDDDSDDLDDEDDDDDDDDTDDDDDDDDEDRSGSNSGSDDD